MLELLNKRDEQTEQPILLDGSRVREVVNDARSGILSVLRKRWMQIRQEGGFADLDPAALEGLSKSELHDAIAQLLTVWVVLTASISPRYWSIA